MSRIHSLVKSELVRFPRDKRGSSQNIFRAAYAAYRLNGLGRRPQISDSAGAAFVAALASVRAFDPTFTVLLRG